MTRSRPGHARRRCEREAAIVGGLASDDRVELFMRCVDRIELLAAVRGGDIDGVVVVSPPAWLDEEAMAEARTASVRCGASARPVGGRTSPGTEHLFLPPSATTDEILSELSREVPPSTTPRIQRIGRGRVIAVRGPKGAPGRSRIAVELSFSASAKDPRTLLADVDPDRGESPSTPWGGGGASDDPLGDASGGEEGARSGHPPRGFAASESWRARAPSRTGQTGAGCRYIGGRTQELHRALPGRLSTQLS